MNKYKLLLTYSIIFINCFAQNPDLILENLINQVSVEAMISTVSDLSGETPIVVNGEQIILQSRYMNHPHNDIAADYIKQKLEAFNLEVHDQYFVSSRNTIDGIGRNIIAVKEGVEFPENKYIICAHYDSYSSSYYSPGADDNASGSAAVIELARILSQYETKNTMVFILFDEEELGMIGSKYYSNMANYEAENILGVINLDMIAYDSNRDWSCDIHSRPVGSSLAIRDRMVEINTTYSIGLLLDLQNIGTTSSDQGSFWNNGIGAVLLIEDFVGTMLHPVRDFNPFYHSENDKLSGFSRLYYNAMVKLALGTFASFAEVIITASISEEKNMPEDSMLFQNYPNPFNPSTVIKYYLPEASHVKLTVYDIIGRELALLVDEYKTPGHHSILFDSNKISGGLSSGIYVYRLQTNSRVQVRKMTVAK